MLLLGLLQVVLIARDQIAIELAAREAARAAAVAAHPAAVAERTAHAATTLRPIAVTTRLDAGRVTVDVRSTRTPSVPLIGRLIGGVQLGARVTMAREPP